jgi:hypothetical protein
MWAFPNYCQEVVDNMNRKSGRGLWRGCWSREGPTRVPTRWLQTMVMMMMMMIMMMMIRTFDTESDRIKTRTLISLVTV